MTNFWPGLVCFLMAFGAIWADDLTRKLPKKAATVLSVAALIAALTCAALGIFHALASWGYIDLVGEANKRGMSVSGRDGIVLTLISLWPFVMILVGLLGALISWRSVRRAVSA